MDRRRACWGLFALLLVAGCGRVGFDLVEARPLDGGHGIDGGPGDGGSEADADGGSNRDAAPAVDAGDGDLGQEWTLFLSAPGEVSLGGVTVDAEGRVGVAARHDGPVTVGDEMLVSPGRFASFLASVDRRGDVRWVRAYRSDDLLDFRAVTASSDGDLLVTGILQGTATLGAESFTADASQDVVYLAHDAAGALTAARVFVSDRRNAQGRAVAVQGDAVLIVGLYGASLDVSPATLPTLDDFSAFVVAIDRRGGATWADTIYERGRAFGDGAALSAGGACAIGWFEDTADLGGRLVTSNGDRDAWVVGYDRAGSPRFGRGVGGPGLDEANDAAATEEGRCLVVGRFRDAVDFGAGETVAAAGGDDAFLAVYEPDGALAWVRSLGGEGDDEANAVDVDGQGRIYVGGSFSGTARLDGDEPDGDELESAGGRDAFVASFEADGTARWVERFGGETDEAAGAIAVEPSGRAIVFGGVFTGTTTLGGRTVTAEGLDAFVRRVLPPL